MKQLSLVAVVALIIGTSSCKFANNEVIDAFKAVNKGLDTSSVFTNMENTGEYEFIEDERQSDPNTYEKSLQLKATCVTYLSFVDSLKSLLIAGSGGVDSVTGDAVRKDDIKVSTKVFIENKQAAALQAAITTFKEGLDKCTGDSTKVKVDNILASDVAMAKESTFNQVPVEAALTILAKLRNDAIMLEGLTLKDLTTNLKVKKKPL